jgi:hypothetical protein
MWENGSHTTPYSEAFHGVLYQGPGCFDYAILGRALLSRQVQGAHNVGSPIAEGGLRTQEI